MYRNGIVQEVDAKGGRARVEFRTHDAVVSWWLNVNQPHASVGASRVYSMPDVGAQVNCVVDEKAEDGTILGAFYSDQDPPPIQDAGRLHAEMQGGLLFDYDRSTGALTITTPAGMELSATKIRIVADVEIAGRLDVTGAGVSHNGKNIGDDHGHKQVTPGPGVSGPPV